MRQVAIVAAVLLVLIGLFCFTDLRHVAAGGVFFAAAIPVKDAATLAKKFVSRGAAAGADYTAGVRGAGERWKAGAQAGKENYAAGVQAAITRGAFEKGVNEAGGAKYEDRATTVGAQRFPQGIQSAEQAWAQGTQPYLTVIAGVQLPPRAPKGDPRNMQRAQAMAEALRRKKIGG